MNKAEFTALPASMIAELIWPALSERLKDVEAPKIPKSPQWDMRLSKKGAYIWASECDLETLQFYLKRAQSPNDNPSYAEKNKKDADSLVYFVRWRQAFPTATWSGARGKKGDPEVTAKAPAYKPAEHQWESKGSSQSIPRTDTTSTAKGYVEEDYSDDSIPF